MKIATSSKPFKKGNKTPIKNKMNPEIPTTADFVYSPRSKKSPLLQDISFKIHITICVNYSDSI
jgi:hypothetical protein